MALIGSSIKGNLLLKLVSILMKVLDLWDNIKGQMVMVILETISIKAVVVNISIPIETLGVLIDLDTLIDQDSIEEAMVDLITEMKVFLLILEVTIFNSRVVLSKVHYHS